MKKGLLLLSALALFGFTSCSGINYMEITKDDPNYQQECENASVLAAKDVKVDRVRVETENRLYLESENFSRIVFYEMTLEFVYNEDGSQSAYLHYEDDDAEAMIYITGNILNEEGTAAYYSRGKMLTPSGEEYSIDIAKGKFATDGSLLGIDEHFDFNKIKENFVTGEYSKIEKSKDDDYRLTLQEDKGMMVGEINYEGYPLTITSKVENVNVVEDDNSEENVSTELVAQNANVKCKYSFLPNSVFVGIYKEVEETENQIGEVLSIFDEVFNGIFGK